jgi:hypothetical protein
MGINQLDVKAALFEDFEQRNPVDPRRLHHDSLNLTLPQPFGQGVEIGRKGPKALHRPLIAIRGQQFPEGSEPQ